MKTPLFPLSKEPVITKITNKLKTGFYKVASLLFRVFLIRKRRGFAGEVAVEMVLFTMIIIYF